MEERDPSLSNAIDSSLWEIQSLQHHALPSIAKAASFINDTLPSVEWDLSAVLDNSSDDIFDREVKKREKSMEFAYDKPNCESFFNSNPSYWNL